MYQNDIGGQRRSRLASAREGLFLAVFSLLPLVGLASGPAYAPMLFGLAGASTLLMLTERRGPPAIDRPLAALALAFLLLAAAGLGWSILPALSRSRLFQLAAILLGCLLLLGLPVTAETSRRQTLCLFWAVAAGAAMLALDTALGYPLQSLLTHGAVNSATKYNRGLIALVLIAWPALAHLMAMGKPGRARLLGGFVILAVLVGLSTTGLTALLAGVAVWLVALKAPRFAAAALGAAMSVLALALPFLMRLLSGARPRIAPLVKASGVHRLEIWDYMSARILERPLSGWGLGAAKGVPIRPEELANYLYVSPDGIYPHNQWIELWLETGLPGVLIALGLVWLALRRIGGRRQAYALAAVASALTASLLNFEITTDSWWAALAASALLFRLLPEEGAV